MPRVRSGEIYQYVSDDAPLVKIEVTFGENLPTKFITLSKTDLDNIKKVPGKFEIISDSLSMRTTRFYIDYHIYPDNSVDVCCSDELIQENWWETGIP